MPNEAAVNIGAQMQQFGRDHGIPGDAASRAARVQELIPAPPLIHVMEHMITLVLVFIVLKYQSKPEILFQENSAPVWCLIAAAGVYWLIVGVLKQMTPNDGWFGTARRAALASAVLSILSLVAMFFPYPVSLVPLMIWILLPVVLFSWPILKRRI